MNYPEEFRERYNEVMFDERDIIEQFLKDQYDIRYGRQRDTWHFEPAVKMLSSYGNTENVTDIMLDKDRFVIFILEDAREFECFDFAYGELSKVIDALPEAKDVVRDIAETDLRRIARDYNTEVILLYNSFKYRYNNEDVAVIDFFFKEDSLICELDGYDHNVEIKSSDFIVKLRDYMNVAILHCCEEYDRLVKYIKKSEHRRFEPADCDDIIFAIEGTSVYVNVIDVCLDSDNDELIMQVEDDGEYLTLTEKDIKPNYIRSVMEYIYTHENIMDTYNGHNAELVNKINAEWRNESLREQFGLIVYAIAKRDYDETVEKVSNIDDMGGFLASIIDDCDWGCIHNVLENVCDDQDLETILSFIRYED